MPYLLAHDLHHRSVLTPLNRGLTQIAGFFHADPHLGNLLIRPTQPNSRSPHNFEIVLLDHGLYFEMARQLRVDYAHLWLSLIAVSTPEVEAERRKYAFAAGNIDESLYPLFQAAITGRMALDTERATGEKPRGMLDMGAQTREEEKILRGAVMGQDGGDGLLLSILDLLRRIPRRMLMVLKVRRPTPSTPS